MNAALLLLAMLPGAPPTPVADVKLPPGFAAYLYSDQSLANDIYTMTVDDAGRVLVAGRGYVRVLVDDDGDGRADRALDMLDSLKEGPMGLHAEGDALYVVADGGLKRYRGYNGKDKLKGPAEVLYAVKTGGEHEAHAVRRGPDGWLYLLCGNMSGVKNEHLDPHRSPVKDPIAGSLLRISPDGKTIEAVADGFRNAYGFDFNLDGEAFTYDSDNERCVGLPWYEPCRFYHVVPGGNYGWRSPQLSQTWRKPPYFADVVPPIGTTGRGSPTGVACYRNTLFPGPYRGNFFIADWTFGKIWFVPLEKKYSTYAGKPEVFLEAIGESGFAPTALAVHPKTGELLVSIGGRGTRGAVYRIAHERGGPATELPMAKRSLDWNAEAAKDWVKDATGADALKRRQALELMLRWREKLGWGQWLGDAVKPSLSHEDALVRAAAGMMVVRSLAPVDTANDSLARLTIALAGANDDPGHAFKVALDVLETKPADPKLRLLAIRVLQLGLGDLTARAAMGTVWEGYTLRNPLNETMKQRVISAIRSAFSKTVGEHHELEREIGRTLAAISGHGTLSAFRFTSESDVPGDIHNLIVIARLDQTRYPAHVGDALIALDEKARRQKISPDRNWPLRLFEIVSSFSPSSNNGEARITDYILEDAQFGRPDHLLLVQALKVSEARAARLFIAASKKDQNYYWSAGLITLVGSLPASETRPTLLKLWERGGLEDAILPIIAKEPNPDDGPKFLVGLRSMNPEVVRASAKALFSLQPQRDKADLVAAIAALRRLPDDKTSTSTREALLALLRDRTSQPLTDAKAWAEWFGKAHPELAAKLNASDGFDPAAWKKREAAISWAEGDPVKGRLAFTKATCASCHDGGGAIGPPLAGVSKRFSRDDLLTSILQPSKDVSPRYRPTRIATTDGKAYLGMIVYEATSGVILQTSPDAVVRIAGEQIESQKLLETSLMPAGLLEKLTDREIADLLAYMRKD